MSTAYGYGFLMIAVISLLSLLGVTIVPFVHRSSKLAVYYKYIITLLISMGVSALVTDALLHLIPNVSLNNIITVLWALCIADVLYII